MAKSKGTTKSVEETKSLDQISDKTKDALADLAYANTDISILAENESLDPEVRNKKKLTVKDYLAFSDKSENISNDKYEGILDYEVVSVKVDPKSGFSAIALKDKDGNISISYRGTDQVYKDMKDNLQTNFIGESAQSELAQAFYDQIKKENPNSGIYLYGHSKGGELAARVMVNNQDDPNIISATLFNPQPLNPNHLNGDISVLKSDRVTAFRNENDIVSHLGDASEDVYNVVFVKSNFDSSNFLGRIFKSFIDEHGTDTFTYDEDGNVVEIDYDINENDIYNAYKNISEITQKIQGIIDKYQDLIPFGKESAWPIVLPIVATVILFPEILPSLIVITIASIIGIVAIALSGHIKKEIKNLINSINNFFEGLYRKVTGKGPKAIATSEIVLDLSILEDIKAKLERVKNKIVQADEDLNVIKNIENLSEIKPLIKANTLLPSKSKIQKCINYLEGTRDAFETAENNIKNFV